VPGTYYLLAIADADGAVAESIETNNVRIVRSIKVTTP
jgi:subtilase family serine protease